MAPLTRSRAIDNIPNALMAQYYALRANIDLDEDRGDLVVFATHFGKSSSRQTLQTKQPLNASDLNTFHTPGPEGYIDYPVLDD